MDPSIVKKCFDEIDRDKTGRIDVEELIIALRVSKFKHDTIKEISTTKQTD